MVAKKYFAENDLICIFVLPKAAFRLSTWTLKGVLLN